MRTLFAGGVVFVGGRFCRADLLMEETRVVAVDRGLDRSDVDRVVDCEGRVIAPTFIDLHTHLRYPGVDEDDDPTSIARAALVGGYGVIVAMANTQPPIDRVERWREANSLFATLPIEVVQAATVTLGREGHRLVDFERLVDAGVEIFSDDGSGIQDSSVMRHALVASAEFGVLIAQHSEDAALAAGGVVNDGVAADALGVASIPEVAESVMVARDIELLKGIPGRLHLQHVSARESLNLFRQAKREGLRISAEVTPHHLLLPDTRVLGGDTRFKVNPPLRSVPTQMALLQGVLDGSFDAVATDHAPHPDSRKRGSYQEAAFGMVGISEAMPATWTALWRTIGSGERRKLGSDLASPEWIALGRLLSCLTSGPAEVLGRSIRLAPQARADLVVIDPSAEPREIPSRWYRSGNSPYRGEMLIGRVDDVFLAGRQVVDEGEVVDA
ncbi:dihydroorotase [Ferrimicrobium acidiphilum]|uniref:dihydroorotase n=1 Tax=Ferrimicrobium acidiphilum TaxID=121039 RepID=UPI0023F388DF|nr:dihydroorotase [Ferrimicrobium acidiphilum]